MVRIHAKAVVGVMKSLAERTGPESNKKKTMPRLIANKFVAKRKCKPWRGIFKRTLLGEQRHSTCRYHGLHGHAYFTTGNERRRTLGAFADCRHKVVAEGAVIKSRDLSPNETNSVGFNFGPRIFAFQAFLTEEKDLVSVSIFSISIRYFNYFFIYCECFSIRIAIAPTPTDRSNEIGPNLPTNQRGLAGGSIFVS
jgi:hypothetical protein